MRPDAARGRATAAAAGVLRRSRAAISRLAANNVLLASLALSVLILIFFYDVVFLERTLLTSPLAYERLGVTGTSPPFGYPGDPPDYNYYLMDPLPSAWASEPYIEKAAEAYRNFQVPLWEPNVALGRPLLANASPSVVSPIRLPLILSPSSEMWDAFLLARLFVAGLFTYLLARCLALAKPAAFGAAVAFAFSGYFMLFINMPNADFAMMIPVLLYSFELLLDRPGPGRTAFAAAAVALGILANNPEAAVIILLYGGGYYLARAWTRSRSEDGFRLWPRLLPLGIAGGVGVGLTAFALVPFIELSGSLGFDGLSVHLHGPGSGSGLEFAPLTRLISIFVPYFHGPPWQAFQGGGWTGIRHWAGVVVPLLALIGLWNRPAMAKAGWFFLGTAVLLTAKWYGVPVINWVGRLPVLEQISFGQYLPPAIGFSLAMLAGLGLDQVWRASWRRWHVTLAIAAIVSLLGWLVWLNRGAMDSIPNTHLALQLGFAGGLIFTVALMLLAIRRGLVSSRVGVALLVGLIAVELFTFTTPTKGEFTGLARAVYSQDNVPVIERPQRYDPFTQPPFIDFLKEDTSKYRVFGLDRVLYPNTGSGHGLEDIRGYTNPTVARYLTFIRSFINPTVGFRFTGHSWPPVDTKGGLSRLADNPMFDLLNAKYIITPRYLPLAYDFRLAEQFLPDERTEGASGRLDVFVIDGEDEIVLFQQPISTLSYDLTPDEDSRFLLFKLAMDPEVWQPNRGDGVSFTVSARVDGTEEVLFSQWVDPKNNPDDRRWIDAAVDLSPYLGRPMTLVLSTGPGDSGAFDWAGWGGLRLAASADAPAEDTSPAQFQLAYDGDVKVYENRDAFPRAFVVHRAEMVSETHEAIARMNEEEFDPAQVAVIEGDVPLAQLAALAEGQATGGSTVDITKYQDQRVELRVTTERAGFLILSDAYYPGWKAYVDGKQVPIYPTDVALRSVFVPAGEHEVKFVFSPGSFKLGSAITLVSLAVLAAYAGSGPVRRAATGWLSRDPGR